MNPTGYAQVLMERAGGMQGTPVRHYALDDDVLDEVCSSGHTYFGDGHNSTRQLMDGVSQRAQYYDAYGEAFGRVLDAPGFKMQGIRMRTPPSSGSTS